MNRKERVAALADKTGSTKVDAERNIAALLEIISGTLKKGDDVALIGFGTFEVSKRAARTGRAYSGERDRSFRLNMTAAHGMVW